jgi:uncharacterized repeat protein (TIGR03943 family)
MKTFLSASMRHRRALLLLAWALAFWGLLHQERYQAFLRPEFGVILAAAGGMSLLLFLAELGRRHQAPFSIASLSGPAILLMPLLYLLNAQGVELDGAVFEKRAVSAPSVTSQAPARASEAAPSSAVPPTQPIEAVDDSEVEQVTHLDLHRSFRKYEGKTVSLIGMAHQNDPVLRDFGAQALLVFRFVVACCAADAQPIAVAVVRRPGQPSFPDSTWVKVRGRFTTRMLPGGRVPFIDDALVSQTAAPKPPYLY